MEDVEKITLLSINTIELLPTNTTESYIEDAEKR